MIEAQRSWPSLANSKIAKHNALISQYPIPVLVRRGIIRSADVPSIIKGKAKLAKEAALCSGSVPKFWPYPIETKKRHIWIHDQYSAGKTAFVRYLQYILKENVYEAPEKPNGMFNYVG